MARFIDLTGQTFGRLTVVERAENHITKSGQQKTQWLCECECKTKIIVEAQNLRNGHTESCGCLRNETSAKTLKANTHRLKHGKSHTRLYSEWYGMKDRCYSPKNKKYSIYGGKGITVCEEWQEFLPFYEWAINNGYKDNLTIDRIDSTKGYSPDNCRWATYQEQNNNRRNNVLLTYDGKTQTIAQWANELGIEYCTIHTRLKMGWSAEKTLTTPVKKQNK